MDTQQPSDNAERLAEELADEEKKRKLEHYRRLNAYAKKGQIVFAGSSLMEQFPIGEFLLDYAISLTIYNRGIGGFVCAEMRGALEECIFQLEPSRVFLNIGSNDLNDAACDNAALVARYAPIVEEIQRRLPDAEVTLLAYYPVNPEAADSPSMREALSVRSNARIRSANAALRHMAETLGVRFLDVNAALTDAQGRLRREYTLEGMHMHPDGYAAVFQALLPYLLEARVSD